MVMGSIILWPFMAAFFLLMIVVGVLFFIFWIWMLVDCVQRKFDDSTEKVVWVLVIIFANWIGALIYYFVVYRQNRGIVDKKRRR